jgi:hypothetical protein
MSDEATLKDVDGQDALMAMAIASVFARLLKGEAPPVAGAALAIALGEWLGRFSNDPAVQEKALDRVLMMVAKTVQDNAQ